MDKTLRPQLEAFIVETDNCIDICKSKYSNIDGALKLSRKFISEKKFLLSLLNNKKEIKEAHLKSSNLRHLKAIINQLDTLENVTGVLKIFKDKTSNVLYVDIVCDSGYTWVKVVARNAQSLHLIWAGEGQYGEKNINNQIEEYKHFAECNQHNYKTPKIIFYFAGGVTKELADYLKSKNIIAIGDIVELDEITKKKLTYYIDEDSDESDELDEHENEQHNLCCKNDNIDENETNLNSELNDNEFHDELSAEAIDNMNKNSDIGNIKKLNLDVTTLIVLVSQLTNGDSNVIFKQPFLIKQAECERLQQLLPVLEQFMKDKELYTCETAFNDFMKIVNTVGGPNERERAKTLRERLIIVPDNPSERTMLLKESSKIKPRAKIIFGTGDSLKAITLTSNIGFVRAAAQQGVKFSYYIHQSRALTEKKQSTAKKPDIVISTSTNMQTNEAK